MKKLFLLLTLALSTQAFADQTDCLDRAADAIGIRDEQTFSPQLLKEVLAEEMHLADFRAFAPTMEKLYANPLKLGALVGQMKQGIRTRHPAIMELVCALTARGVLNDSRAERVNRILHHSLILEHLVQNMVKDLGFMEKVKLHFLNKRQEFGLGHGPRAFANLVSATGDVFETAKMLTVDQTMNQYLEYRRKVNLTMVDRVRKNVGLVANLTEAITADLSAFNFENAAVGAYLKRNLVQELRVTGPERMVEQHFVPGWSETYETWNLAFVTGRMDYLDLVYPKLIIPQVIDARPEQYLYKRGITLWVTINIVLISKLQAHNEGIEREPFGPFPQAASIWGKINKSYVR